MSHFEVKNAPNSISAKAPPQTPLRELIALPRHLAGFRGPTSKGREGKGGKWEGSRGSGEDSGGQETEVEGGKERVTSVFGSHPRCWKS